MKFLGWLILYASALLMEVSILPAFLGGAVPSLSIAALLMGIALQEFGTGFWFAGLAGVMRDILAPPMAAVHTIFFLGLFLAMHFSAALVHWDEPARRIGALGAGLAAGPLLWILSSALGKMFFGVAVPALVWSDFSSGLAMRETVFAAAWFLIFSWVAVRRADQQARRRLARI